MVTASAADREPPNPSGLARITLVAQILLLSPMQSSLHLHSGVTIAAITRSVALLRVTKRDVMSASLAAEAADAPIWVPLRGRQVDGERASLVRA